MRIRTITKGLAVCAIAATAAGCSSIPGGDVFSDKMHITADFENIAGMYPGNDVSVLGLPVGKVDSVEPKGTFVEVRMSIDSDVKIPADAKGALLTPSLVTNRHVELAPAYSGDGPVMQDGDHIPIERTKTPVELDRVLQTVDQISAALKGNGKEGPLSGTLLLQAIDGKGDQIRQTIDALSTALQIGVTNRDAVSNTIVKLNELTQVIAENDQTVRDFSDRTTRLTGLLAEQAPGLQAVLDQLNQFLANTSAVLDENKDQLGGSLKNLTSLTDQLRANARNLTETIDLLPMLMDNLGNAVQPTERRIRVHALTDKSALDNELLSVVCEKLLNRPDGCRSGRLQDMGPDFGLTAAMLGTVK